MYVNLCAARDIAHVHALFEEFNKTKLSLKQFKKLVEETKGNTVIFCGYINQLIVGYLILKIAPDIEEPGIKAEATDFYVRQKYRGQGLGRMLLQKATGYAKQRGAKRLLIITDDEPSRARRLYRSFGFRKMKGAIVLEKKLS